MPSCAAKKAPRRERKKQVQTKQQQLNFTINDIFPLTENQKRTFEAYKSGKHLLLTGSPGTGKTFLSLYLALANTMQHDESKIIIVRSVVPTRDMGFLPGNNKEKSAVYEVPYQTIFSELFNRGDAYQVLKQKSFVEFMTTSFIRGITLSDCTLIIDEIQNMNASELHSIFSRIGKNCRVILCGDIKQNDLQKHREQSGFLDFFKILNKMN